MAPTKVINNKADSTAKSTVKVVKNQKKEEEEEEEEELCFICTEPITIYAVSSCDHRTCFKCALRLRALYETKNCAYCKSEQSVVIFTKDDKKPFDSYNQDKDTPFVDKKLNIRFETQSMYKEAMHMLDFNCPMQKGYEKLEEKPACQQVCDDWNELKQHVIKAHQKNLCDLCTRFKKIFPYEHTLYTPSQLQTHCKEGDKSFLPDDETGFSGHPECGFCKKRYFSDDELFIHCRDSHEQCFLCVKMHGRRHEYYQNYDQLEEHFKTEHFLCLNKSCLEKKFVVFGTDIDLKAHDVEVHGGSRQLDLNLFQYDSVRNQRRNNKGKGKATTTTEEDTSFARGPTVGVLGQGSSSHGRNAARSNSSNRDEFPAMKTKEDEKKSATKPRVVPGASGLQKSKGKGKAVQKPAGFGALSTASEPQQIDMDHNRTYNQASSFSALSTTTENNSTVAQHQAFLSKVGNMLQSKAKVAEFKSFTKAYRNNTMSGEDYVNQIALLTNQNVEHTDKILKGVENLMDKEEKKWELIRLWRNKHTAMTQFPALEVKDRPLAAQSLPSSRVLVIKGPNSRQARKAIVGASSSSSSVSSIGSNSKTNKNNHQQKNIWDKVATAANRANGVYSNASSARTSPQSSRPASPSPSTPSSPSPVSNSAYNSFFPTLSAKQPSSLPAASANIMRKPNAQAPKPTNPAAFPALPTASKTKHEIILNMRSHKMGKQNAWDSSSAASNNTQTNSDTGTSDTGNTKKKKGRKNNVLFRVGL